MKQIFCILIFINIALFSFRTFSQSNNFVKFHICSENESEYLPNANLIVNNSKQYFTADKSGNIKIDESLIKYGDTLYFSYMGHVTIQKKVSEIDFNKTNNIILQIKESQIKKVIVNPIGGEEILLKTKKSVPENYPNFPMNMKSYFIEKITFDNEIIREIEAVVDIYKESYTENSSDKISFSKARINVNDTSNILWKYMYFINGPYECIYSDIAKYPDNFIQIPNLISNFYSEKQFENYTYKTDYVGNSIKIFFSPDKKRNNAVFEGFFKIDRKTYSIESLEYKYCDDKIGKVRANPSLTEIDLEEEGIFTPAVNFKCIVYYGNYKGNTVLEKVYQEYSFEFRIFKNEKISIVKVSDELIITDYNELNPYKPKYIHQIPKMTNLILTLPKTKFTDSDKNPKFE
jgi:hypothetical protein